MPSVSPSALLAPLTRSVVAFGALFVAAIGVAACGAPADDGSASSASSAISTDSVKGCPASAPQSGVACVNQGLQCTWGADARFGCRTESVCTTAGWSTTTESCSAPAPACPRSAPDTGDGIVQCSAAQDGLTCEYSHQSYTCAPNNGDLYVIKNGQPEKQWWTSGTTQPKGCPTTSPNLGSACGTENLVCDYGGCFHDPAVPTAHGSRVTCTSNGWQQLDLICIN